MLPWVLHCDTLPCSPLEYRFARTCCHEQAPSLWAVATAEDDQRVTKMLGRAGALVLIALAIVAVSVLTWSRSAPEPGPELDRQAATSQTISLPVQRAVLASVDFDGAEGEKRLVSLIVNARFWSTTERKRAAYIIVGVNCSGGRGQTMSGTQNLTYDTDQDLRLTFIHTSDVGGPKSCRAVFSAPSFLADKGPGTVTARTTLSVSAPLRFGMDARPNAKGGELVLAGETTTTIDATSSAPRGLTQLQTGGVVRLTTCTIVNGSTDGSDGPLCPLSGIDARGSTVSVVSHVQVLDRGRVCDTLEVQADSIHIDRMTHHRILGSPVLHNVLDGGLCGTTLQVTQTVTNDGPAPVVIHRGGTNVVVAGR